MLLIICWVLNKNSDAAFPDDLMDLGFEPGACSQTAVAAESTTAFMCTSHQQTYASRSCCLNSRAIQHEGWKGNGDFEDSLSIPCFTSETVGKLKSHAPHL